MADTFYSSKGSHKNQSVAPRCVFTRRETRMNVTKKAVLANLRLLTSIVEGYVNPQQTKIISLHWYFQPFSEGWRICRVPRLNKASTCSNTIYTPIVPYYTRTKNGCHYKCSSTSVHLVINEDSHLSFWEIVHQYRSPSHNSADDLSSWIRS